MEHFQHQQLRVSHVDKFTVWKVISGCESVSRVPLGGNFVRLETRHQLYRLVQRLKEKHGMFRIREQSLPLLVKVLWVGPQHLVAPFSLWDSLLESWHHLPLSDTAASVHTRGNWAPVWTLWLRRQDVLLYIGLLQKLHNLAERCAIVGAGVLHTTGDLPKLQQVRLRVHAEHQEGSQRGTPLVGKR